MNAELRQALILEAAAIHEDPTKWPGETLMDYIKDIQSLIETHRPESILDYGCGKAILHKDNKEVKSWKCDLYDPAYTPFAEYPTKSYDMIICTDVLEHIPPENVIEEIANILNLLTYDGIAFFSICCRPAHLQLPSGINAHRTVAPPEWWKQSIRLSQLNLDYRKRVIVKAKFNGTSIWNDL